MTRSEYGMIVMDGLKQRLEAFIIPEPNTGCWLFMGALLRSGGYGAIEHTVNGRKITKRAHRVAYEIYVGPIPAGFHLDHICRQHCCVNPSHLEPVTPRENWRRGEAPSAICHRTGRCKEGHILNQKASGRLYCWRCHAKHMRDRRAREGFIPNRKRRTAPLKNIAQALSVSGLSIHAIARELKISRTAALRIVRGYR